MMTLLPAGGASRFSDQENRVQFMCQRLQETLNKKEQLRTSAKNVKLL